MSSSPLLADLIDALRCLPGVGAKTAQRMAFHVLERDRAGARKLAERLAVAVDRIGNCTRCRTFSEDPLCALCANPRRDRSLLCVVETPVDQLAIEPVVIPIADDRRVFLVIAAIMFADFRAQYCHALRR